MAEDRDAPSTVPTAATSATVTFTPGLHGTVAVFDGTQEEWIDYAERLDSYFIANDIRDAAKKRAILLNAVGPSTYRLIKTLCLPGKPTDHSFEEIVDKVKNHINPKPSPIVKRLEFNKRKQLPGESVAEYIAAIRKIAEDCEYGTMLNEMLRDRLVLGVTDKRVQKRSLRESKLSYTESQDMALAAEAADKDSQSIQESTDASGQITPVSACKEETIARVHRKPTTTTYRPRAAGRRSPRPQRQQTPASDHKSPLWRRTQRLKVPLQGL